MAQQPRRIVSLAFGLSVLVFAIGIPGGPGGPSAVAASGQSTMASVILGLVNTDRVALGLRPLRLQGGLVSVAADRAGWMASHGLMTHQSFGGRVRNSIAAAGITAWSCGEAIGWLTGAAGSSAAHVLYRMWKGSPEHWDLIVSRTFNYIGIGVASLSGRTYASLVFAETPDVTGPVASMTGASLSGSTLSFTWTGRDVLLQTHTSGLASFDVAERVDDGAWTTILVATTHRALTLDDGTTGHVYAIRVRGRDGRGNVSAWSSARAVPFP